MQNKTSQPVAVIILNWNGAKLLREYLPQVVANTNAEIGRVIVVDNGSTDDSRQVLEEEFPEVEKLYFTENYGFAEGYNRALEYYKDYPYTVLLNSDVAPAEGWLEPLYGFMEAHPEAGGCQPKLKSYTDKEQFEYAGACGGFLDVNGYPYCRGRIFDTCETDAGQYNDVIEVDWASGAALMIRTELYLRLGGLDKAFFAHMEEIDLCWRVRLAGYKLYAVPQSVIYHLGGGSLPPSSPKKTYLNFRNNLLMLYKNLPEKCKGWMLIRRRLLDTIAWAKEVATLHFANAGAIVKAHRDFARMRPEMKTAGATSNLLAHRPNILVKYYLLGKKTFKSLSPINYNL